MKFLSFHKSYTRLSPWHDPWARKSHVTHMNESRDTRSVLQCVAVCCRVLQYIAVCLQCVCSMLQCVAACWSVLQCAHMNGSRDTCRFSQEPAHCRKNLECIFVSYCRPAREHVPPWMSDDRRTTMLVSVYNTLQHTALRVCVYVCLWLCIYDYVGVCVCVCVSMCVCKSMSVSVCTCVYILLLPNLMWKFVSKKNHSRRAGLVPENSRNLLLNLRWIRNRHSIVVEKLLGGLQCVAVRCSMLQYVAILQCAAVCDTVLQCAALCCRVLFCATLYRCWKAARRVAVGCNVCCSMLQCCAVCYIPIYFKGFPFISVTWLIHKYDMTHS